MLQFLLRDPEPLLYGNELICLDGRTVGHLQIGGYGHTLCGSVGLGFATLEQPITAEIVERGPWQIEIAGQRHDAVASLKPLYDATLARVRC